MFCRFLRSVVCKRLSSSIPNAERTNLLKKFVVDRIRSGGPISVHECMQLAISSGAGYYSLKSRNETIFGSEGDFVTSPEISQVFGELVGVWVYNELQNTGHLGEWQLVEFGPGNGLLAGDIIRTLKTLEKFKKTESGDMSLHLVEIAEPLMDAQEATLGCRASARVVDADGIRSNKLPSGHSVCWHRTLNSLPKKFSVFLGNEFLDALPIHQFQKEDGVWKEVYVNLTADLELCFMLSKGENLHTKGLIPQRIRDDADRTLYEISPQSGILITELAERITENGGFGLFVDYGHNVDPLADLGNADLTADVDFGSLRKLLEGMCLTFGPVEQRHFLSQMGIHLRMERLLSQTTDRKIRNQILAGFKMLLDDNGMGVRFKAFSFFPSTLSPILQSRGGFPAGFFPIEQTDE